MEQRQVALVTGARRGIGRAIALELAEAGFNIAITDVEPSGAGPASGRDGPWLARRSPRDYHCRA